YTHHHDCHKLSPDDSRGKDLTIKVRNAGDALYDLVLSAIEKVKIVPAQKVKELAAKDRYQSDCNCS
ncbi:MAG: hypothetical protein M3299_14020, partial [Thermoproteota archaeon]|nr:hypothetical protein [Thermoproteota archaeon]